MNMSKGTSLRLNQVMDFIIAFKRTHDGNSPSVREIGKGCGITSTSAVHYCLKILAKNGKIDHTKFYRSRMIVVPGGQWIPPSKVAV